MKTGGADFLVERGFRQMLFNNASDLDSLITWVKSIRYVRNIISGLVDRTINCCSLRLPALS